jgi:hypothetical protein
MAHKGKFKPKNPQKYRGNTSNITYRSGWERQCMMWFDSSPTVLEWNSEGAVVRYISPVDGESHRYFIDFYAKIKRSDGLVENLLIEVKPFKQTQEPKPRKRKTMASINEENTWKVNDAKWKAARKVAESLGWKFMIVTEYELGIAKHK